MGFEDADVRKFLDSRSPSVLHILSLGLRLFTGNIILKGLLFHTQHPGTLSKYSTNILIVPPNNAWTDLQHKWTTAHFVVSFVRHKTVFNSVYHRYVAVNNVDLPTRLPCIIMLCTADVAFELKKMGLLYIPRTNSASQKSWNRYAICIFVVAGQAI